ncbi:hypothetical protein [Pseudomonas palleroniana]
MFHLPPIGVCACLRQALSAVCAPRVNARVPANILDGPSDLLFAFSTVTDRLPSTLPLMILHNFGLRNATQQQMTGKLLP